MKQEQEFGLFLQREGINIDPSKRNILTTYVNLLIEGNQRYNLFAPKDEKRLWTRHIADSLQGLDLLPIEEAIVLDLGSGGGLPGIPISLLKPSNPMYLLEPRRKKADFLRLLQYKLKLMSVTVLEHRAEDIGHMPEYRETFDYVLARGVASLPILMEYSFPLLQIGGRLIAWKGKGLEEEIKDAYKALEILGGEIEGQKEYKIQGQKGIIVLIRKNIGTDSNYPREGNTIRKRPL